MARPRRGEIAAGFACLALSGACAGDGGGSSSPASSEDRLQGRTWQLESLRRGTGELTPAAGHVPEIRFGAEAVPDAGGSRRLGGSGGCNLMGGSWRVPEPGRLSIGELISTKRACLAPGAMEMEQAFFETLQAAERFEVRGDTLGIRCGRDGATLLLRGSAPGS